MERLNIVEFERAIDRHLLWQETGHREGEPAVFRDYFIDCNVINIKPRNLSEVMFENCKFKPQLFMYTKFDKTIFQRCILYRCVFWECTFIATEFQWCNMSHTYFMADHPSLFSPSFLHTSLYEAGFVRCDLSRASFDEESKFFLLPRCPEGSFIAYKIAQGKIVKLRIPSDAKRSNATTNKCRGSKAEVLAIENLDGTPAEFTEVSSDFDDDFIYRIGETVSVPDFDENRWNECSSGIHFFLSREEAAKYGECKGTVWRNMDSCPLDTKVRLLASDDCLLLPQREYVGTITLSKNKQYKTKGECYEGDPDYFYRSKIVAWKPLKE